MQIIGLIQGRTQGGLQSPKPPKTKLKKKTDIVDTTISNVLRDFPFSQNQPLKSADD
jgi:hypothetical protein